jgi:hypothetical protein
MPLPEIPKTPERAYNPKRPASALLCAQIAHLEQAVGLLPRSRPKRWKEGEAAAHIGLLTARLLKGPEVPVAPPASSTARAAHPSRRTASRAVTSTRRKTKKTKKAESVKKATKMKTRGRR